MSRWGWRRLPNRLAYATSGEGDDARKALERALMLDPQFNGSADARRVLAGLKG